MADEHDVMQIFPEDDVDDVLNVRVEVNIRAGEIAMFTLPGECRAIDFIAAGGEQIVHVFPIPTAAPCAMHDDIDGFFIGRCRIVRFTPGECGEADKGQYQTKGEWFAHLMSGMLAGALPVIQV
jgi:hypothetical protein